MTDVARVKVTCRAGEFEGVYTVDTTIGQLLDRMREDAGLAGADFRIYHGERNLHPDTKLFQIDWDEPYGDEDTVNCNLKLMVDGE